MIISRAPVRISFFGGGTDYPEYFLQEGGAVLATAIDKFSYVTASPFLSHLFDYSMRISYRKVEIVKEVQGIEHNVFRECLKLCNFERDIELHNCADLPAFTGLGSSSAFTVSLLHALHTFKGEFLRPHELAYEAIHVERHILKDNVGCRTRCSPRLVDSTLLSSIRKRISWSTACRCHRNKLRTSNRTSSWCSPASPARLRMSLRTS